MSYRSMSFTASPQMAPQSFNTIGMPQPGLVQTSYGGQPTTVSPVMASYGGQPIAVSPQLIHQQYSYPGAPQYQQQPPVKEKKSPGSMMRKAVRSMSMILTGSGRRKSTADPIGASPPNSGLSYGGGQSISVMQSQSPKNYGLDGMSPLGLGSSPPPANYPSRTTSPETIKPFPQNIAIDKDNNIRVVDSFGRAASQDSIPPKSATYALTVLGDQPTGPGRPHPLVQQWRQQQAVRGAEPSTKATPPSSGPTFSPSSANQSTGRRELRKEASNEKLSYKNDDAMKLTMYELKDIFDQLDRNGDGEVSHAEFIKGLKNKPELAKKLGIQSSFGQESVGRDEYVRKFNSMDLDGNHHISFEEMLQAYAPHIMPEEEARPKNADSAPEGPVRVNRTEAANGAKAAAPSINRAPSGGFASFAETRAAFQSLQAKKGVNNFSMPEMLEALKSNPEVVTKLKGPTSMSQAWAEEQVSMMFRAKYGPDCSAQDKRIEIQEFCRFFAAGVAPEPESSATKLKTAAQQDSGLALTVFEIKGKEVNGDLWGFDGASGYWKRRKFFLDGNIMHYQQEDESSRGFGPKMPVELFSSSLVEVMPDEMYGKDNCFTLTTRAGGDCYLLSADTKEQRNAWILALESNGISATTRDVAINNFMKFSFPCLFGDPLAF